MADDGEPSLLVNLVGDEEYVQVREDFRFDATRLRKVITMAADESGWGAPLPDGSGRGISASYNQGAWVAEVAEVTVQDGSLKVDRITCAIDCGLVINPQGAVNQVEGGIIEERHQGFIRNGNGAVGFGPVLGGPASA